MGKPCDYCGTMIHWDSNRRGPSGKAIPLEDNNEGHNCPSPKNPSNMRRLQQPQQQQQQNDVYVIPEQPRPHQGENMIRIPKAPEQPKPEQGIIIDTLASRPSEETSYVGTIKSQLERIESKVNEIHAMMRGQTKIDPDSDE